MTSSAPAGGARRTATWLRTKPTILPPANAPSVQPPALRATIRWRRGESSMSGSPHASRCKRTHASNSSTVVHSRMSISSLSTVMRKLFFFRRRPAGPRPTRKSSGIQKARQVDGDLKAGSTKGRPRRLGQRFYLENQETGFYPVTRRLSPATPFAARFHARGKAAADERRLLRSGGRTDRQVCGGALNDRKVCELL